jgi:hypothetical protein
MGRTGRQARALRAFALAAIVTAAASCSDVTSPTGPDGGGGRPSLGIDTSLYPGDAAMQAWASSSPYRWTGFYLAAPCHRDATWTGHRAALAAMGWGMAVIYVGQQDWANADRGPSTSPDLAAAGAQATCSASLLSTAQGTAEADDAIAKAASEGFPPGAAIFLDVERVQTFSPALEAYVRAWTDRVLVDGRYAPAIYVHVFNAQRLYDIAQSVYSARGVSGRPRFWITTSSGFSRDRLPTDVGFPFADAWQGEYDRAETWGGYAITVDVSVSSTDSPSGSVR